MHKKINFIKKLAVIHRKAFAIFYVAFFTGFLYLVLFSILKPSYLRLINKSIFIGVVSLILIVGFLFLFRSTVINKVVLLLDSKVVLFVVFCFLFLLNLLVAYALQIDPSSSNWDPLTIFQAAHNLTDQTKKFADNPYYFQAYPNNLAIVAILAIWFEILNRFGLTNDITLSMILTVIILNVSLLLTYLLTKKIIGAKIAIFALILGIVFITLSLWSQTYYTDTIGIFFPICTLYLLHSLFIASSPRKRIVLSILLGLIIGLGYLIKPTTIFVGIAALISYSLFVLKKSLRSRESVLQTIVISLVILIGAFGLSISIQTLTARRMAIHTDSMPASSFAMMGLSKVCDQYGCRYGSWNLSDALSFYNFKTMDEYQEYTIDQVQRRIEAYGPLHYIVFLSEKGAWIIGDGTFFAYGEGSGSNAALLHTNKLSRVIQSVMHPPGSKFALFEDSLQVIWLSLLFCMLLPFILVRKHTYPKILNVVHLALFGLILFLLLFEARSRYLYLYIPLFIVAASYGFNLLLIKSQAVNRVDS